MTVAKETFRDRDLLSLSRSSANRTRAHPAWRENETMIGDSMNESGRRKATEPDVDRLFEVDELAARLDEQRRQLIREAVECEHCVVAVNGDGVVVGFVVTRPGHFFGRDFVELLAVDRSSRRAGVGRALLAGAVAVSISDRVFTSTNQSNAAMHELLAAEGWTVSGQLDGLDDDPEIVYFVDRPGR